MMGYNVAMGSCQSDGPGSLLTGLSHSYCCHVDCDPSSAELGAERSLSLGCLSND